MTAESLTNAQPIPGVPSLVGGKDEALSIQYLRALAAILVVFAHAREQFPGMAAIIPWRFGYGGVDIFFVISGFVMTYSAGKRRYGAVDFLRRRLVRIAPLYWTMTLVTAALLIAAPTLVRDSRFAWSDLFTSLAFFPHTNAANPQLIAPMLKLGWTLNYEMGFYLLFAATLALGAWTRTALLAGVFLSLILAAFLVHQPSTPLVFWGAPVILEFVFGCALGAWDKTGQLSKTPRPAALSAIIFGAAAFGAFGDVHGWRLVFRGVPALVIVAGALAWERAGVVVLRRRVFHFLGDASYSIYLSHLYALIALRLAWQALRLPTNQPVWAVLFVILCLATGIGLGCVVYRWIERPLIKWAGKVTAARPAPSVALA